MDARQGERRGDRHDRGRRHRTWAPSSGRTRSSCSLRALRQVVGCAERRVTATGWFIGPEAPDKRRSPERTTSPADEAKDADDRGGSGPDVDRVVPAGNLPTGGDSMASPSVVPAGLPALGGGADEMAAARRANERSRRLTDGLAELAEWLRDRVRVGFAASAQAASKTGSGAEQMAARMVDAQAPGVAGALRGLSPVSGVRS